MSLFLPKKKMMSLLTYIRCLCGFTFSSDDEHSSGSEVGFINGEKVDININAMKFVADEKIKLKVWIQLLGSSRVSKDHPRVGADIVLILDVPLTKRGVKGSYMGDAFRFFIDKLTPIDRLSVIKVSGCVQILCPLQEMTPHARPMILDTIRDHLFFNGDGSGSDLAAGLRMALQVFNDRNSTEGRKPAILLFSDQEPTHDVASIPIADVPVHAFSFDCDSQHEVLKEVVSNSSGGTFSILDFEDREPRGNFRSAFMQCLAQLCKVPFKELEITLTPFQVQSAKEAEDGQGEREAEWVEIEGINEFAGNRIYAKKESIVTGPVTFSLGCVYTQDKHSIDVGLSLPTGEYKMDALVLQITYSYSNGIESYTTPPLPITLGSFKEALYEPFTMVMSRRQTESTNAQIEDFENKKHLFKTIPNTQNKVHEGVNPDTDPVQDKGGHSNTVHAEVKTQ